MQYAIIAAGEGSRLSEEGVAAPKPLVKVGGECLIDRLLRIFMANGATAVSVVCRPDELVESHVEALRKRRPLVRYVVRSTPGSMHSFLELTPLLEADEPFVLTTVDTVFDEREFAAYVAAFVQALADGYDGLMGVTGYVDDERPLYVKTDERMEIQAFLDSDDHPRYVSAGIYGLTPRALGSLQRCVERGELRMRNFQRALLADGRRLKAWAFGRVYDIDHAADIVKAEQYLQR